MSCPRIICSRPHAAVRYGQTKHETHNSPLTQRQREQGAPIPTEAHIPLLYARDNQMCNTLRRYSARIAGTRALDKLRCRWRSASSRPCDIGRLWRALFVSTQQTPPAGNTILFPAGNPVPFPCSLHCWANRGPPEPGESLPGGGIPGTPQILRKLLAPAIVQFDDHGKILRVSPPRFPKAAHTRARTHIACARIQTQEELTKGVFGVSFCASGKPRFALPSPGLFPAPLQRP